MPNIYNHVGTSCVNVAEMTTLNFTFKGQWPWLDTESTVLK